MLSKGEQQYVDSITTKMRGCRLKGRVVSPILANLIEAAGTGVVLEELLKLMEVPYTRIDVHRGKSYLAIKENIPYGN